MGRIGVGPIRLPDSRLNGHYQAQKRVFDQDRSL